ncbi:hypothetical protein [Nocardia brasiliensis]|uniref:hypothetical protein n=1 Tax=Nocardia brasiliensis TaxID=37326 RepID=UPI003D8D1864
MTGPAQDPSAPEAERETAPTLVIVEPCQIVDHPREALDRLCSAGRAEYPPHADDSTDAS